MYDWERHLVTKKKAKSGRKSSIFSQYKCDVQHDLIALNTEQFKRRRQTRATPISGTNVNVEVPNQVFILVPEAATESSSKKQTRLEEEKSNSINEKHIG